MRLSGLLRLAVLALTLTAPAGSAAPLQGPRAASARDVLPEAGLIGSSVVRVRDQAALAAHYYLADENVLELGRGTDAALARYRAGGGEALVLAVAYPSETAAERVYGRFGRDFFGEAFDPEPPRFLALLETGDFAGAARVRSVLVVVLEAPGRKSCDELLRRLEERAQAAG